jgi:hypothetical protein
MSFPIKFSNLTSVIEKGGSYVIGVTFSAVSVSFLKKRVKKSLKDGIVSMIFDN